MFRSFFCACLLIELVKTNPVLLNCPGAYCDQITNRNSLAELSDIVIPTFISSPSQVIQYDKNVEKDQIYKLLHDRLANNPSVIDAIRNVQRYNNEDISNFIRNSGNIPNIVNNYIFLPTEEKSENDLKPSNVNLESSIKNKNECDRNKKNLSKQIFSTPCKNMDNMMKYEGQTQIVHNHQSIRKKESVLENTNETNGNFKDNIRKTLKRSLEERNLTKKRDKINSNLNQNERLFNSSNSNDVHRNKKMNPENTSKPKKSGKDASKQLPDKILNEVNENDNSGKTVTSSNKGINSTHKNSASHKHSSKIKKSSNKIKNSESEQKRHIKEQNRNKERDKQTSSKTTDSKNKKVQTDNSLVQNDVYDMYKYIDALLSNYQLTNNNLNSGFPFDYNNFYQFSQPPTPWNSINTVKNKTVPHKRRKLQRLHAKRLNKKRAKHKKKHVERKSDDQIQDLSNKNVSNNTTCNKTEEIVSLSDKILKNTNMISLEESENLTKVFEESFSSNNNFTEGSSHYNSIPSFIIGIEETVPFIFEDGFIDDYYPNFTADNKALHMTPEDKYAKVYNSDKYHYVSNHNFDFEDYIKKRKELAMHNKNTNTKLFFSEKATDGDVKISEEDVIDDEEIGRLIQFQSPPLLDNPDFRTRKIESPEKYEPYYYHNVLHDPDEDFNKYYSEKKAIVYPTSFTLKNNVKNKLCNEIDDSISKAKWKKIKDSNVETVYARSKLAKYGLVL